MCKKVTHTYNKFWGVIRPSFSSNIIYPNPITIGTYWGDETSTTIRPVVNISNPDTVEKVRFAVWSTGDQSDIKWFDSRYNGNGSFFRT